MIHKARLEKCLATIRSICASPRLDQYLIGYTAVSASQRADQYRSQGFTHFAILADKLTQTEALDLEGHLQAAIWSDKDNVAWEKYHHAKKANGRIYRSTGGNQMGVTINKCSVYMAWWDYEA